MLVHALWYNKTNNRFKFHHVHSQEDLQKLLPMEIDQIKQIYCVVNYIHRFTSKEYEKFADILKSDLIYTFFIYLLQMEIYQFLAEENYQIRLLYFLSYKLLQTSFSTIEQYIQKYLSFIFFDCDYDTYGQLNIALSFRNNIISDH